jgi:hypothetical protein
VPAIIVARRILKDKEKHFRGFYYIVVRAGDAFGDALFHPAHMKEIE